MSALEGTVYDDGAVCIVHGDAREVLCELVTDAARAVVITDPVWPNAPAGLFDVDDPEALFAEVAQHWPRLARRAVVVLGCTSDPRMLAAMPADHAPGRRVYPGECTGHGHRGQGRTAHPCLRCLDHMRWLVAHFTQPGDLVIDPFGGSGTTARAKDLGRRALLIEKSLGFCQLAIDEMRQEVLALGGAA